MTTLIALVVLARPHVAAHPVVHRAVRQVAFSERIRSALGEAWRLLVD